MKFEMAVAKRCFVMASRPARGEWIEIQYQANQSGRFRWSRPARGEWIEITLEAEKATADSSLAPHGASGLKYY